MKNNITGLAEAEHYQAISSVCLFCPKEDLSYPT
jgi:hypothetical protein